MRMWMRQQMTRLPHERLNHHPTHFTHSRPTRFRAAPAGIRRRRVHVEQPHQSGAWGVNKYERRAESCQIAQEGLDWFAALFWAAILTALVLGAVAGHAWVSIGH